MAIKLKTNNGNIKLQTSSVGGSVFSVNGQTGNVILTAEDVGALPKDTVIPSIAGLATEEYVNKAIDNIPKTDLTNYTTETQVENKINEAIGSALGGSY